VSEELDRIGARIIAKTAIQKALADLRQQLAEAERQRYELTAQLDAADIDKSYLRNERDTAVARAEEAGSWAAHFESDFEEALHRVIDAEAHAGGLDDATVQLVVPNAPTKEEESAVFHQARPSPRLP
jgi:chromosome segregation ATPase